MASTSTEAVSNLKELTSDFAKAVAALDVEIAQGRISDVDPTLRLDYAADRDRFSKFATLADHEFQLVFVPLFDQVYNINRKILELMFLAFPVASLRHAKTISNLAFNMNHSGFDGLLHQAEQRRIKARAAARDTNQNGR